MSRKQLQHIVHVCTYISVSCLECSKLNFHRFSRIRLRACEGTGYLNPLTPIRESERNENCSGNAEVVIPRSPSATRADIVPLSRIDIKRDLRPILLYRRPCLPKFFKANRKKKKRKTHHVSSYRYVVCLRFNVHWSAINRFVLQSAGNLPRGDSLYIV